MKYIKFRQKIVNENSIKVFHYWGIMDNGSFIAPIESANHTYWVALENSEKYTGLHDENNTEIYEGDIVKGYLMINDDDYSFTDVVSYKAPSFVCDNSADFGLDMYELEVIGNIYENPELLKEE